MMGQLVGRGGGIQVFAAQGFGKGWGVHGSAQVVDGGVALVKRYGIVAVFLLNGLDAFHYGIHRFRPGNGLPTLSGSFHRGFEPIGVFVNVFEGYSLGANVATAEGVIFVASNAGNLTIFEFDLKATHGFAKVAVAVVELRHDGGFGVSYGFSAVFGLEAVKVFAKSGAQYLALSSNTQNLPWSKSCKSAVTRKFTSATLPYKSSRYAPQNH
jgi:hypothetical protein